MSWSFLLCAIVLVTLAIGSGTLPIPPDGDEGKFTGPPKNEVLYVRLAANHVDALWL